MEINQEKANKFAVKMRKGIVADVKLEDAASGFGYRSSIYIEGCIFSCVGCYNKKIQSFNYGKENADAIKAGKHVDKEFPRYYDQELEDIIIESLRPDYIAGLTLLGGEPFMNTNITLPLARRVRKEYGDSKTIWSWTGYEWDELLENINAGRELSMDQARLLRLIDVLVDGRYVDSIRQEDIKNNGPEGVTFRGSSNQRIINVPASLQAGKVIERTEFYEGEIIVPRDRDFKKMKR